MSIVNIAYIMTIASLGIVFYSIIILNLAVLIILEVFLPPICALILSITPFYFSLPHSYEASAKDHILTA